MSAEDDVAIVGIGCRFPGADNIQQYWQVLKNGENHVKDIPKDRWNIDAFYDPDPNAPGKTYVRKAGFVSSIEEWDHRFHGINDMEAELVDPQQRMVLDCVHMALEDGGIRRKDIEGTDTGVFIGCMTDDYKGHVMDDSTISSTYSVTGTQPSIISARVAYSYNLSGTAITLDTACSSSLVAINLASQELKFGSCKTAICGGVNVLMDPQLFVALSKARMLSPTGQCKTFTNEADGYARGEGCGIVILKKVKEALKDGNKIWATIKTGSNQDGHMTTPITAPSGIQQEKLVKKVYEKYCVDKSKIQVIEAHGTGTPIGDPTEVNALGTNFGRLAKASGGVYIGSVKSNIGHLEAAAGVAGLIKVLLMMKHETIVPSLWYTKENENPKLNLSQYGFEVPTKCFKWDSPGQLRRLACVNSFGFGGTNAHAIVEEYSNQNKRVCNTSLLPGPVPYLVTLSAFDTDTLVSNVRHLSDTLKLQDYDLASLSCTSTCKRDHRSYRKTLFGRSQEEILGQCSAFLNLNGSLQKVLEMKSITFVFCGVGTAWNGMCKSLMDIDAFKTEIQMIDKYLKPLTGWKVSDIFLQRRDVEEDPMVAHIALFACQVGLVALWSHYGIKPDAVVGQSVGEVAAAYVAGIMDLQTAVKVIYNRSKFLAKVSQGKMAVVRNVDTDVIKKICDEGEGSLHISVFQSHLSCTVSGTEGDIQKLRDSLQEIKDNNPDVKDLHVQCAYHSPYVDEASKQLGRELKGITFTKSKLPIYSTVSGKLESDGWFGSVDYWEKNVRLPVMFGQAIKSSVEDKKFTTFLEIGPAPVLQAHISNILTDSKNYKVVPSMKKLNEIHTLTGTLCDLYESGFDLNWSAINPCQDCITEIPTYQLRKYKQLYQSPTAILRNQGVRSANTEHLYITQQPQKEGVIRFKAQVDEENTPFVFQHIVTSYILLPGAFYADIGFEICRVLGFQLHLTSVSLEFLRPVKVEKGTKTILYATTINQKDEVLFHVKHNQITMCKGWVQPATREKHNKKADIDSLKLSIVYNGSRIISRNEIYDILKSMGFQYGPYLRLLDRCTTNGNESLTDVTLPPDVQAETDKTTIHPCILDAMMQTTILTTSEDLIAIVQNENLSFLPVSLGKINVLGKPKKKMLIYTKRINSTLLETVLMVHYNILLMTTDGNVVADLRNYTTYGKRNAALAPCELTYRLTWHPFELETASKTEEPLTIVLTSRNLNEIGHILTQNDNNIIFRNDGSITNEQYTDIAFSTASKRWNGLKNVDAVLLIVGTEDETDIHNNTSQQLHTLIKDNCMLFTELVNSMTKHSFKANLYIITQNTQATFPVEKSSINIVGGELWGFVRSVYTEFIHGDITLVDLQSSNVETKETLHSFIKNTYGHTENTKLEVVIYKNVLYGAQFTKQPKKEIIPSLRDERRCSDMTRKPYRVLASISKHNNTAMFSPPVVQLESSSAKSKDLMTIRIKSVCLHPSSLFPRTTGGKKQQQDIWQEPIDDGHQIFGLEYIGYQVHKRVNGRLVCRKTKVESEHEDFDNQWGLIVLFPAEIQTEMSVPTDCTISLKDIPFYQPGLLLYAMLSWHIVNIVPKNASVMIHCKNETELPVMILQTMLKNRKNSYILDLSKDLGDKQQDIDILITLESLDIGFFLFGKCKTIICFEDSVSDSVKAKVEKSGEQNIRCVNVTDSLARKHVSKVLPKVVRWLQNHYRDNTAAYLENFQNISAVNIVDEQCKIPCPTLELLNEDRVCVPVRNPLRYLFDTNGVYIITGGSTGLGLELLLLIAHMGAGLVVSMSRREVSDDAMAKIRKMEEQTGCKFFSIRADVTNLASVQEAIEKIKGQIPKCMSVKGIFHGAGVLQSKLMMDLDEDNVELILKPKVLGTLNMHVATKSMNLDYFVVASSINSLVGSPGQCSYGAANAFLDTFVEWRRRKNLSGQSINWGALSVGMASRPEFTENFSKRGFNLLTKEEIRSCFQQAMMQNSTCTVFANINWDMFAKDYTNPKLARIRLQMSVLLDQMVSFVMKFDNDGIDNMAFDVETLKLADEATQKLAITQIVEKVTSKVSGEVSQITTASSLAELSFDSMSTVTFINILHDVTGYRIEAAFMMDTSHTLEDIISLLHDKIFKNHKGNDDDASMITASNISANGESDSLSPVDI